MRQHWRRGSLAALLLLAACGGGPGSGTGPRLSANFDAEPIVALPVGQPPGPIDTPPPDPPADLLTWGSQFVTTRLVGLNTPNHRVRVVPNEAYFAGRQARATVLLARSDAMSGVAGNNLRGGLQVTLSGSGMLVVALFSGDATRVGGPLGGFKVMNPGQASLAYLTGSDVARIQAGPSFVAGVGTFLGNYAPGTPVDLRWSIDQASRTLSLGAYAASGVAVNSVIFDARAPDGAPNTPVQRIWMDIALYDAQRNMVVLLDNLSVEEIR